MKRQKLFELRKFDSCACLQVLIIAGISAIKALKINTEATKLLSAGK